jgi:hypothetical protein
LCRHADAEREHRSESLGNLNGHLGLPACSLPLGDMPIEALDAALAGLAAADPHHDLALDQAAMDLHDNDEVTALWLPCMPRLELCAVLPLWQLQQRMVG